MIIAVAGCVAQAEGAEILARAPYVDIVLGPQTYHRLPEMVARAARAHGSKDGRRAGAHLLDTEFPVESKFDHLPESRAGQGLTAFLSVQEGCDKFCTFCVVPYTRGAEFSRPVADIAARRGAWWPAARARSRCWARTSMPITAPPRARSAAVRMNGASAG